jgi:predicted nucleotidyltransferase
VKTAGLADVLRQTLEELGDRIVVAFVHGSMASGTQKAGSDEDLVVIGSASFGDVVAACQKAQQAIGREVNPTVYPVREFHAKLRAKHHFVTSLMDSPKIFLIGNERELDRLVT